MNGIIVVSNFWTRLFSFGRAKGVTVFPFIILGRSDYTKDQVLINHERIHIRQAVELFVVPFYLWYFFEFVIRYIQEKDLNKAYLAISFEKEAYVKEKDEAYLCTRKYGAFLSYL